MRLRAFSLNEDSLTGAVSVKTSVERSDRFNTVNGVFIDPSQNYKSTEFPEVFTTAARNRDNGEILTKEIQLPMTNSRYMAQRIANKLVQQSDQQKVVTFPTNLSGMEVAIGDRVSLSLSEFNWSNKVFLCLGWTLSDSGNGGINLILREDDSGSYADPAVGEYSTVSSTGALIEGFRGVPDPSNLSATAGLKSIELNWTNPDNMSEVLFVEIFASPNSSWASRVKVGETNGTQFFHDGSTTADPLAIGDQRYYWVRARAYSTGEDATAVSDRNPDNDTSTISATVGGVDFDDVVGDAKPEDNATVGATVGTDLYDDDGTTVLTGDDVLNQVLEQQILNVQIETGEVLDLETGQDVAIQNLGDVAIYVNESNQIINSSIGSLNTAFSNLENTLVDLTTGVSDVYVQATPPVAGVGSIPDPIPTFSRWYDSDDSNEPYYWTGSEWVSLADPRIASNAASIVTLQSGLNTANSNISGNSSAISVLDATTISQGSSIASLSSDVTTLQSDLTTAEGDIVTNASAISGLTTRVTTAEGEITSQASDITTLETTVNDPTTGVSANATAISGLDTRVTANESSITSQATQTTALNASLSDLLYIQDEADSILETEAGGELLLNLATDVSTATSEIVETLDSRVVATEQGIVSQSQALTALESELGTVDSEQQATATAVSALTTRVTQTETDITINSSDITSLESSLTTANGNITANASAISSLDTRVTSAEGSITVNSSDITSLESSLATTDGNVSANATAISSLDTRVTSAEGSITSQASDITQLQSDLTTLDGTVSGNSTAISSLTTRVTDNEGDITSTASSLTALSSTVTDPTTGLAATAAVAQGANTLAQTLDGEVTSLQAEAYLTVSAGGNIAGFKATADSTSSDFTIQADRFALVSTNEAQTTVPFVVNGTTGLVGFNANVVVNGNLISTGTIAFDKLVGNVIKNQQLSLGSSTAFTANGTTDIVTLTLPAPDDTTVGHLPVAIVNLEWYIQAGANWEDDGGDLPEVLFALYQSGTIVGSATYTHPKFNDSVASFERHSISIVAEGSVTTSSQAFDLKVSTVSFDLGGGSVKGYVSDVSGVILGVR
jgi:predicted  nucleic acid-binding Zn-ribbon protein